MDSKPLAHNQIASGRMTEVTNMGEVDEFLSAVLPRQRHADISLLNGGIQSTHQQLARFK